MLRQLLIRDYLQPLNEYVEVDDPVWKAWRLMKQYKVKCLPVVKNNKIVGVLSDRDILQISDYNGGQSRPVKEAMSLDPLVVQVETPMDIVLGSMIRKDHYNTVVVDESGNICGLFSWEMAFQFFLEFSKFENMKTRLTS